MDVLGQQSADRVLLCQLDGRLEQVAPWQAAVTLPCRIQAVHLARDHDGICTCKYVAICAVSSFFIFASARKLTNAIY